MNATLARLNTELPETRPDRRREPRYSAWFDAIIESSKGQTDEVLLSDVSMHGCCIKSDADWLRIGSFIQIGLGDHPKLSAIVRWVRDGSAGMEFLRPIAPEREEWYELVEMPY